VRSGVRLGVDVGTVRVGVAVSDPAGVLATPVETVPRPLALQRLAQLVVERQALEVVIGLPLSLSGSEGSAAAAARAFAEEVATRIAPVPVRLVDERLTTVGAETALRRSASRGGARSRRRVLDQAAAVLILQAALDTERARGAPAGEALR
jgi:putative Holliday junction resolvase